MSNQTSVHSLQYFNSQLLKQALLSILQEFHEMHRIQNPSQIVFKQVPQPPPLEHDIQAEISNNGWLFIV